MTSAFMKNKRHGISLSTMYIPGMMMMVVMMMMMMEKSSRSPIEVLVIARTQKGQDLVDAAKVGPGWGPPCRRSLRMKIFERI